MSNRAEMWRASVHTVTPALGLSLGVTGKMMSPGTGAPAGRPALVGTEKLGASPILSLEKTGHCSANKITPELLLRPIFLASSALSSHKIHLFAFTSLFKM